MSSEEFLMSLKKFIAAGGRPKTVISDNGKTFVVAARWIRKVVRNEKLQDYLSERGVKLQLNLSNATVAVGACRRVSI